MICEPDTEPMLATVEEKNAEPKLREKNLWMVEEKFILLSIKCSAQTTWLLTYR